MASARRKVVIVGGGAGGLILANSLAIRGEYDITLINDTPYHYYWPQLLQIAFRGDDRQLRRPIDLASEINRWLAAEVYATALITPIVDALATLMACGRAVDARSLRPYCIATRQLFLHKFA